MFLKGVDEVDSALRDPKLQLPLKQALNKQATAVRLTLADAAAALAAAGQTAALQGAVVGAGLQVAADAVGLV
eukprot:SAG22_NODE_9491_length_587_cov_0.985656_1_plen_72_part_10